MNLSRRRCDAPEWCCQSKSNRSPHHGAVHPLAETEFETVGVQAPPLPSRRHKTRRLALFPFQLEPPRRESLLAERGIEVSYETIRCWTKKSDRPSPGALKIFTLPRCPAGISTKRSAALAASTCTSGALSTMKAKFAAARPRHVGDLAARPQRAPAALQARLDDAPGSTPAPSAERPAGTLCGLIAPRAGLLPPTTTNAQVNLGLSLWMRNGGHVT